MAKWVFSGKSVFTICYCTVPLFIIGDWNAKVGGQETPEVTGKFGCGVRNEAG